MNAETITAALAELDIVLEQHRLAEVQFMSASERRIQMNAAVSAAQRKVDEAVETARRSRSPGASHWADTVHCRRAAT